MKFFSFLRLIASEVQQNIEPQVVESALATDSYEAAFFKMLLALGALLLLLLLSFWAFRRLSRGRLSVWRNGGSIKILERKALSPKSVLYVIEHEQKKMIIAESQVEVRLLSNIETKNERILDDNT